MFEIYSSDTDEEPQLNLSAAYGRRRLYSNNNTNMDVVDKNNITEQLHTWNHLKLHIDTAIHKLNPGNIRYIRTKLFQQNIVRGKGLFCRAILNAQSNALDYSNTFATLVSFVNLEFPNIVELLLVRCIVTFSTAYNFGNPMEYVAPAIFIAHLVKHCVAKDSLALDLIKVLLKSPTSESMNAVENIMNVCCKKINSNPENKPALKDVFDILRNFSQDDHIDKSVQTSAGILLKTYQHTEDELQFHLVDPRMQYTHLLTFNRTYNPQYELDNFVCDLDYMYKEITYKNFAREIVKVKRKIYHYGIDDFDEMADDEMDNEE